MSKIAAGVSLQTFFLLFLISSICILNFVSADLHKPDGQFVVEPTREGAIAFMNDLSVRKIPGTSLLQARFGATVFLGSPELSRRHWSSFRKMASMSRGSQGLRYLQIAWKTVSCCTCHFVFSSFGSFLC